MAKGKHPGGRPAAIDDIVKTKLEYAFSCNCNKTEACLHAGISTKTLERYIEKNPEFSPRIAELRSHPRMTAKLNVTSKLAAGDVDTSKWVLNHTDKEYKPKSKVENDITVSAHEALINALNERKKGRE